eukprot:2772003-Rhodomonas_salina.1
MQEVEPLSRRPRCRNPAGQGELTHLNLVRVMGTPSQDVCMALSMPQFQPNLTHNDMWNRLGRRPGLGE